MLSFTLCQLLEIFALHTDPAEVNVVWAGLVGAGCEIDPSVFLINAYHGFYEEAPVTHIDVPQLYCPEMRDLLIKESKKLSTRVWNRSVLVCTEGPRYETPAEIEMFRRLGCDVVSMTGAPEAVLARELEMCYATLCFVTNMAAGIQARLTARELSEVAQEKISMFQQVLRATIGHLPKTRNCPCAHALEEARLEVE